MPAACLASLKALKSRHNQRVLTSRQSPLHPDPLEPIMYTRAVDLPSGLGGLGPKPATTFATRGSGQVVGKVVAKAPRNQTLTQNTTPLPRKSPPIHVCAHAPARACGGIYLSGSGVVVRYKPLIRKGKWHYFCHYLATTCPVAEVVAGSKSLKSFEKGDF